MVCSPKLLCGTQPLNNGDHLLRSTCMLHVTGALPCHAAAQALRSLKQEHVASVRFEVQQRVTEMRGIDARLQQLLAGR